MSSPVFFKTTNYPCKKSIFEVQETESLDFFSTRQKLSFLLSSHLKAVCPDGQLTLPRWGQFIKAFKVCDLILENFVIPYLQNCKSAVNVFPVDKSEIS